MFWKRLVAVYALTITLITFVVLVHSTDNAMTFLLALPVIVSALVLVVIFANWRRRE